MAIPADLGDADGLYLLASGTFTTNMTLASLRVSIGTRAETAR